MDKHRFFLKEEFKKLAQNLGPSNREKTDVSTRFTPRKRYVLQAVFFKD